MSKPEPPIIFLAFASVAVPDHVDLPRLAVERRRIRKELQAAVQARRCELIERADVTLAEIVEVFQQYSGRIAVLHFAGHADGFSLLMQDDKGKALPAGAQGLAQFLSVQPGLQLVFLNACSTSAQVQGLHEAAVPAVIATRVDIPDEDWVVNFAATFYGGLGGGKSVEDAFVEAKAVRASVEYAVREQQDGSQWELSATAAGRNWHLPALQFEADTRPPSPPQPVPMMADHPPTHFVDRPKEYEQIISCLLAEGSGPVAITATLRGAGGFGKTTLAQAICHDDRIRAAFPDGILWATIGDDGAKVLPALGSLYHCLSGQVVQFVTEQDAIAQFSALLGDRRCLIVIDDVWHARHLIPFLQGGPRCARLVTTRLAGVVPNNSKVTTVDAMEKVQAAALLGRDLPTVDPRQLADLAAQLGEWPLLLTIVNRRLYEDVVRSGLPLPKAVAEIRAELGEFGVTAFDIGNEQDRSRAVGACIGASLRHLRSDAAYGRQVVDEIARFQELAVFPEDVAVPIAAVAVLWQQTGELSALAAQKLCQRLADLSLILHYDRQAQTILLHDVVRRYLIDRAGPDQCRTWQQSIVSGYQVRCGGEWWRLPDDGYVYRHLPWHMREAEQCDTLDQLLQTYRWLSAKLQGADIVSLIVDFTLGCDTDRHAQLGLLQHALQMSASVLARDKSQLASQLYGRLAGLGTTWAPFVDELDRYERAPWLQPRSPMLTPPGGNLLYTLSGHTEGVSRLLMAPDGRLITACAAGVGGIGSRDHTVRVWDVEHGTLLHSLEGHTDGVSRLLLAPNGRLITACGDTFDSRDHTVKVWDIEHGTLLYSLEGHTAGVRHLVLAPGGRLITACGDTFDSRDHTVKVWDIEHGTLLQSLEGHMDGVSDLLLAPDGRLITACGDSGDHTVKVWDIAHGTLQHSLEGHSGGVDSLVLAPGGQLITACGGSRDHTVKVWDIERCTLLYSLEGHTAGVRHLVLAPDGKLVTACGGDVSGASDRTVKVWDIERGTLLQSLEGHMVDVARLLLAPDGKLITACVDDDSGASDRTVRVWDIEHGTLLHSLEGHSGGVSDLLLAPDGRLIIACGDISSHSDHTVKVWNIEHGTLLHSLEGHMDGVDSLVLAPDGRLITACGGDIFGIASDRTVKVWNIEHGTLLQSLEGHTAGVRDLVLTPDGRLFTACGGSRDHTVKVWDIEHGTPLHSLEVHKDGVSDLLLAPDGRLITACGDSGDHTVKVWDIAHGTLQHSLEGHSGGVDRLLLAPNGHLITACGDISGASDHTVKVWDIEHGTLLYSLEGHTARVRHLVLAPDGRLITACGGDIFGTSSDRTVKVWDIEHGTLLQSLEGHTVDVASLVLAPDGRLITACAGGILGASDYTVKVWDIEHGTLLHSLEGHTAGVRHLVLAPDGRLITSCGDISGASDHTVKVWDIEHGTLLQSLEGHMDGVSDLLLAPDGRLITACGSSRDHTVKVWDIEHGTLLHSLEGHTAGVRHLVLAPGGRLITACGGSRDHTVKVWDIAHGTPLHSLEGHRDGVDRLLLAPDGRLITACADSSDYTVKVWDIEHGTLQHSLESHYEPVQTFVIGSVDDLLVTVAGDTINLWRLGSFERIAQFTADGVIMSFLLAPDGSIVLGDGLGRVHFLTLVGYPTRTSA